MYIQPTSVFRILRNIPFNIDRKHTILFSNEQAQSTYFIGQTKYNCTNFTYIRHSNSVKVPYNAELLWDCNYCMFNNGNFGTKWFYAFITKVEYINNETSEVFFELDEFQSWWFKVYLGECFVEREHVADDTIGLHTVNEPLSIGENVVQKVDNLYFGNGTKLEDNTWEVQMTATPSLFSGITGQWTSEKQGNQVVATSFAFDMDEDISHLNDWLNGQSLLGNEVTSMTMFPKFFRTKTNVSYYPMENGITRPTEFYQPIMSDKRYTPLNNKLFTYPYTFMRVSNNQGVDADYKWENMADGTTQFEVKHYVGNGVSCELRPSSYEDVYNRNNSIGIQSFPEVSFLQNTAIKNVIDSATSMIGGVLGAFSSSVLTTQTRVNQDIHATEERYDTAPYPMYENKSLNKSGMADVTSKTITNGFNPMELAKTPLKLLGTLGDSCKRGNGKTQGNLDIRWGTYGFTFYQMTIKPEYAKQIDNYFTRFGYQVNEYKVPELYSRSRFNFVKTVDCNVIGDAPNEALAVISAMFDNGLTLWHTTNIGDYEPLNEKI